MANITAGIMEKSKKMEQKTRKRKNIAGKLITVVQLILSVILLFLVGNSGMLPGVYLALLGGGMFFLFAVTFFLQYIQNGVRFAGIVFSILISAALILGMFYFLKVQRAMGEVGGATYKTDNMVVVVKADDSAETLQDAANYRFGYQTGTDQKNNDLMLEDMKNTAGRELKLIEYDNVTDLANALLAGEVEAAVYNQAFDGIIEENIEGYQDQVKILYQYGIQTELQQEETSVEGPFHVYISGIDVAGEISTNSRSDVNIIMTVNPTTKKILLTTTPRDFYVTIPGISGDQRDKLTHAGIYGVDASMATLEQLYGIDISYYARVNFTSLITIVDALGGVDVESEYAFTARGHEFVQGTNHLDGEAALAFARERYSFEEGDNQRGRNQEAVLTAILKKAMSPAILTSADQILTEVGDCVETNMTRDEMARFINMQLDDGASWSIESTAAAGTGDSQPCYSSGSQPLYVMWPDDAIVADISRKMAQVMEEE